MAVVISAGANLLGAFVTTAVAKTVGSGIIDSGLATQQTVIAALVGAITWNLVTWRLGLPSSSTHALIGGLIGAALVQSGSKGVQWNGVWEKVVVPGALSPLIGFAAAFVLIVIIYRVFFHVPPGVGHRGFRLGQLVSGTWVAFTHGANDAQKTMGVIALALAIHGGHPDDLVIPTWVKVTAGLTIAAGTYAGGWRIIRTLGQRIYKMAPEHGFGAQLSAGTTLYLGTRLGFPISTTHVVTGSVMGAGAVRGLNAVKWGVAGSIVTAWLLTLPAAALVAAALYYPVSWIF
jgi:PiT family inorganic phosphate transporter